MKRIAFRILACTGFMLLLGAVGNQDLAHELGVYRSFASDLPCMVAGLLMFVVGTVGDEFGCRKKF